MRDKSYLSKELNDQFLNLSRATKCLQLSLEVSWFYFWPQVYISFDSGMVVVVQNYLVPSFHFQPYLLGPVL